MNDTPFTTVGDEPVEARIVAWVLGEASAFEVAELERLCEERPELQVFKRRMIALHGLLIEASQADGSWKLPDAKRKALDEILDREKVVSLEAVKEKRIQRSGLKAFLVIAACVILAIVVLQLVSPVWIRNEVHRSPEKKVDFMVPSEDRSTGNVNESYAGKPLTTPLPAELVEGTPKPINVPNLEAPVDGPAGYSSWEDGEKGQVAGHADAGASGGFKKAKDRSVSAGELADSQKSMSESDGGAAADPFAGGMPMSGGADMSRKRLNALAAKPAGSLSPPPPPSAPVPAAMPLAPAKQAMAAKPRVIPRLAEPQSRLIEQNEPLALDAAEPTQMEAAQAAVASTVAEPDWMDQLPADRSVNGASESAAQKNSGVENEKLFAGAPRWMLSETHFADGEQAGKMRSEAKAEKMSVVSGRTEGLAEGRESSVAADPFAANDDAFAAMDAGGKELASGLRSDLASDRKNIQNQTGTASPGDSSSLSLQKAIRDQEAKVEERRKLIATIVRTKGIIYKGADSYYNQGSVDEDQDYSDAKRDFETDQELLQQLKLKLHSAPKAAEPAKPKPDFTRMIEEIAASEDPYSTFSLNISDASFQIAQAALAKGETPDPAGIKVEQFYNAVDYGDPAPSTGEPVAVNIEQSAHPIIPGRNLVRVALKTAAAGRSASQPLRLTLLVDQSGSMVREDRRAAMDKALAGLTGLLTDKDLVTVIGFSRTPRLLADGMSGDKAGKLAELVNQSASEGGTNLEQAIKLAEQMAERRKLAGAQNRIVLFTDGAANLGNADPAKLAESVKQLRQKGIAFDIAGIAAEDLNDDLLGDLARNGNGRYYVVGKGGEDNLAKQLAGAFRPAAENVKVQVRFNPERVGRYKLIGFEKDRLKTEDFRNDAVDAAELAAEEAGVAVYQVEPLPGGKGELGEVSVRFRDAASAEMVERTWTIPHDNAAPVLDRATPSMQLAVLSMLTAEKLKGGPLGEAIDMNEFVKPRANVRQFYGHNVRVTEMLGMMDSLK